MALRAVASPFKAFGSWYLETAQKHPFATAFWTSGIKTSAADYIAQKWFEQREEFDWTRHLGFVAFGFCYLGGVQYYLYNVKFVQWCGGLTNQVGHVGVAPLKTLMDQGIHHPFIYFPAFFLTRALVEQRPHPIDHAWHKWQNEVWTSLKALWTLWVPGQIINFALVPRYLRVPFAAGISFTWCIILSLMQGSSDAEEAQASTEQPGDDKATVSSPLEPRFWQRRTFPVPAPSAVQPPRHAPAAGYSQEPAWAASPLQLQQPDAWAARQTQSRSCLLPAHHPAAALMRCEGMW